jgi:uncharacterized membrane protein YhaH (DUF805 family)
MPTEITFLMTKFQGRLSPHAFGQRLGWTVASVALLIVYFVLVWHKIPTLTGAGFWLLGAAMVLLFCLQIYWCACLVRRLRDAGLPLWAAKALMVSFLGYIVVFISTSSRGMSPTFAIWIIAAPLLMLAISLLFSIVIWTRPTQAEVSH